MSTHQYKDMENQPSFAERTKQLKEIAFQLKNAADVVLAEVQHMEPHKSVSRRRPRPTAKRPAPKKQKPRRGLAGHYYPNTHIVP